MTTELFYNLVKLIMAFISTILTPLDNLILQFLPSVSNAFTRVGFLLDYILDGVGWAISLSGIPPETLSLIGFYFTFKLTAPFVIYCFKLGIKWYHYLKV